MTKGVHFFSFLAFFYYFLGFSSTLGALISSLSFLSLFIVTLAVVATLVANSKAPPAKLTLQPLHFQIPHETLLTLVYRL